MKIKTIIKLISITLLIFILILPLFIFHKHSFFFYLFEVSQCLTNMPYKDTQYGVIDKNGKEILPCKFDSIEIFGNYLICKKDLLRSVYTQKGELIIPPKYINVEPLEKGYFLVGTLTKSDRNQLKKHGLWEVSMSDTLFTNKSNFFDHIKLNICEESTIEFEGRFDRTYGIIDKNGKEIVPIKYKQIYRTPDYNSELTNFLSKYKSLEKNTNTHSRKDISIISKKNQFNFIANKISILGKYFSYIISQTIFYIFFPLIMIFSH